jgi:ArsR family transcriptional regulator, arsenate/arsenite/antimonite-responsive transcriptional repressor
METKDAVTALSALAHDNRLEVFRQLVEAGPEGVVAGELAARLGIPPNTLSFHLKTLHHAGLVASRQSGRYVHYSANYALMGELLGYLTENCCARSGCAPAMSTSARSQCT